MIVLTKLAELIYQRRRNRLWYQAKELETGKQVKVVLIFPNLKESSLTLEEYGYGLYYFEFDFNLLGDYVGIFFEDSVNVGSCILRVAL